MLIRNLDFLLKNVDFKIQQTGCLPGLKADDEARPHIVTVAATPANPDAVHEAAAEVRRLLATHASVAVHLLPGIHHVGDKPLRLGKQDGAAAGSSVTWKSAGSNPASFGNRFY